MNAPKTHVELDSARVDDVSRAKSAYRKPRLIEYARPHVFQRREADRLNALGEMLADATRIDLQASALRKVITEDSIVLAVGDGAVVPSLLACQSGARRVYLIGSEETTELLREVAFHNQFGDRLVVINESEARARLHERAHVLLSDPLDVLPPVMRHLRRFDRMRQMHIVDGGQTMPRRCRLFAALVHSPAAFDAHRRSWTGAPHGLNLGAALRFVQNKWHHHRAQAVDLRSSAKEFATIVYASPAQRICGEVQWTLGQACRVHGVLVWFAADLADTVTFSNHPDSQQTLHEQAFFPFVDALTLEQNDVVSVILRADPAGDDYIWSWNTNVESTASERRLTYAQSEFAGHPISKDALHRRSAKASAKGLSVAGQAAMHALHRIQGGVSFAEIADEIAVAFPGEFDAFADALEFVVTLSEAYGSRVEGEASAP